MLDSQATSLCMVAIYKQLFTDVEWDAISSAMEDYSDYGTMKKQTLLIQFKQKSLQSIKQLLTDFEH